MLPTADYIVPCFNESDSITAFYSAFVQAFEGSQILWHLIMIDDGSTDDTFSLLQKLAARDTRVSVISFSRNFGKEAAIYAGLQYSSSNYVGIIDADLQQPPKTARKMLEKLIASEDLDCIAAYQDTRKENVIISALKSKFYAVFARASRTDTITNASDFRIFKKEVARAILSMPEYYRFSKGMFSWVGFNTFAWPYVPEERASGKSKWSFWALVNYAIEGLFSFTIDPLHFITKTGIAISFISVIYTIVLIIRTLFMGVDLPGYASTISLILLFGGGQLFAIGIIGEYLGRSYIQGKQRPVFIVRKTINTDTVEVSVNRLNK